MVMCWECDIETERPMTARLGPVRGPSRGILLCPECYRTHYLVLAAGDSAGAVPCPPLPEIP